METECFFLFEIIINVRVGAYFMDLFLIISVAGTIFGCPSLTIDARLWRLNMAPSLKGLNHDSDRQAWQRQTRQQRVTNSNLKRLSSFLTLWLPGRGACQDPDILVYEFYFSSFEAGIANAISSFKWRKIHKCSIYLTNLPISRLKHYILPHCLEWKR